MKKEISNNIKKQYNFLEGNYPIDIEDLKEPFEPLWVLPNFKAVSAPLVYDGILYVSVLCYFMALDPLSGKLIWRYKIPGQGTIPAFRNDILFFGGNYIDDYVYCLDKNTGDEIWKYRTGQSSSAVFHTPLLYEDSVIVTAGKTLHVLNIETGKKMWSLNLKKRISLRTPILAEGKVFVFTEASEKSQLHCIDFIKKEELWKINTTDFASDPIYVNKNVFFIEENYYLNQIKNLETGNLVREKVVNSNDTSLNNYLVSFNDILIGILSYNIIAINLKTNRFLWDKHISELIGKPIVSNSKIYFATASKGIFCLDLKTGKEEFNIETNIRSKFPCCIDNGKLFLAGSMAEHELVAYKQNSLNLDSKSGYFSILSSEIKKEKKISNNIEEQYDFLEGNYHINIDSVEKDLKVLWKISDFRLESAPLSYHGILYVSVRWYFMALNSHTGKEIWRYKVRGCSTVPAFKDNMLVFGGNNVDNRLYCLDKNTGKEIWTYEMDSNVSGVFHTPLLYQDSVFVAADETLYIINIDTGKKMWSLNLKNSTSTYAPILVDNKILVFTKASNESYLHCIDIAKKEQLWEIKTTMVTSNLIYIKGIVFFADNNKCLNQITNLEKADLKKVEVPKGEIFDRRAKYLAFYDDILILVFTVDVMAIDLNTYSILWETDDMISFGRPILSNSKVYFCSKDEGIFCFDLKTGKEEFNIETNLNSIYPCSLDNDKLFYAGTMGITELIAYKRL